MTGTDRSSVLESLRHRVRHWSALFGQGWPLSRLSEAVLMLRRSRHGRLLYVSGWLAAAASGPLVAWLLGSPVLFDLASLIFGVLVLTFVVLYLDRSHVVREYFQDELALLGASAIGVGTASGLGKLAGNGLRLVSGRLADRTHAYWPITIAAVACTLAPVMGRAGPPYATDDPEPVEHRHWEVYLATQGGHDRDGNLSFTAPHVEVNYGAAPDLQLHLVAPLQYARPSGGAPAYGYGDTEVGAKYRFVHEGDVIPQVATFPLLEIPTGDSSRGLGAGQTQLFLPIWLQKGFGRWLVYGGGGYWINPGSGNRNWVFAGLHAEVKLGPVSPGLEIFHETSQHEGEPSQTRFNVGAQVDLSDLQHILLSAGRILGVGGPAFQWYLAYQLTFGPEEQAVEGQP